MTITIDTYCIGTTRWDTLTIHIIISLLTYTLLHIRVIYHHVWASSTYSIDFIVPIGTNTSIGTEYLIICTNIHTFLYTCIVFCTICTHPTSVIYQIITRVTVTSSLSIYTVLTTQWLTTQLFKIIVSTHLALVTYFVNSVIPIQAHACPTRILLESITYWHTFTLGAQLLTLFASLGNTSAFCCFETWRTYWLANTIE